MCLRWEVVISKKFLKTTKLKTPENLCEQFFVYAVNEQKIDLDSVEWQDELDLSVLIPKEFPSFLDWVKSKSKKK